MSCFSSENATGCDTKLRCARPETAKCASGRALPAKIESACVMTCSCNQKITLNVSLFDSVWLCCASRLVVDSNWTTQMLQSFILQQIPAWWSIVWIIASRRKGTQWNTRISVCDQNTPNYARCRIEVYGCKMSREFQSNFSNLLLSSLISRGCFIVCVIYEKCSVQYQNHCVWVTSTNAFLFCRQICAVRKVMIVFLSWVVG